MHRYLPHHLFFHNALLPASSQTQTPATRLFHLELTSENMQQDDVCPSMDLIKKHVQGHGYAMHTMHNIIVGSVRFRDIAAFVCCQGPFLPSFISKGHYQVFLGTSSAELGEN